MSPLVSGLLGLLIVGFLAAMLLRRPVTIAHLMGFVLGAAPFAVVAHAPVALALCVALWGIPIVRGTWVRPGWLEGLTALVALATLVSLAAHGFGEVPVSESLRWLAAAAAIYPLRCLTVAELRRVALTFSGAAALGGLVGAAASLGGGATLSSLGFGFFEYGLAASRTVGSSVGGLSRLIGPYGDPNVAGLFLFVALVFAMSLARRPWRGPLAAILLIAMLLTLSRAAMGTALLAVLLVIVFSGLAVRSRVRLGAVGLATALAALAVPAIRARLFDSFGPYDVGSAARWEAIAAFPSDLDGHVLLGVGPGAEVFSDALSAAYANPVAHTVLHLTLQRGVVAGAAMLALLVVAVVIAWRMLSSASPSDVWIGAGVVALVVVALQLDVTVVTIPAGTAVLSLLFAVLTHPGRSSVAS